MGTRLLSVLGNHLLVSGALCCLWLTTDASRAQAQAKLDNPVFHPKQLIPPPPQPTVYECKGTVSAVNIPAGTMTFGASFTFQRRLPGMNNWTPMFVVNLMAAPVNGTASFDTGYSTITPSPVALEEFRVSVTANYVDGMGNNNVLPVVHSPIVVPKP